ncbi:hypothetical protein SPSYN_01223 [Sporotomaculum syntrophicum]|uniref:Uncharacterized protein n=1 Tax=Sporotomaculum syntrophicum TaxID=182264 RepID=A0A9D2WR55_9FIRM|nr:hypothetical protein SPSYN_01223 [Sporotomaculum syntrophicum]
MISGVIQMSVVCLTTVKNRENRSFDYLLLKYKKTGAILF